MSTQERIDLLLQRWAASTIAGEPLSIQELCREQPDLAPEVERRIQLMIEESRLQKAARETARPKSTPTVEATDVQTKVLSSLEVATRESDYPSELGGYVLGTILGEGGMGRVYEGIDHRLNRRIAIKVMRPEVASNPEARERFLREARAAAALEHDHIITIHHVGEEKNVPFLVMPLLKGEPLDARLKREGRLPVQEVLRIAREMAEGLATAHERGMVHRDIKPANVWLEGERSRVKILDFGLARDRVNEKELTRSGAVLGTPAYMAPEQANGEKVDSRADLFALGCVIYHMAKGQRPFEGESVFAILTSLATHHPVSLRDTNQVIPIGLSRLTDQLLSKRPEARPVDARAVVAELRRLEDEFAASSGWFRRNLVGVGTVAIVIGLLIAVGIQLSGKNDPPVTPSPGKDPTEVGKFPNPGTVPEPPKGQTPVGDPVNQNSAPKVEEPQVQALGETKVNKPASLGLGTTGKAILDVNQSAYVAVQLSAKIEYKLTIDIRLQAGGGNIMASASLLDEDGAEVQDLMGFNEIDIQFRHVARFSIKSTGKYILRIINKDRKATFWTTVQANEAPSPKGDDLKKSKLVPFCGETIPVPIEPGKEIAGRLEAGGTVYHLARLPKGDYKAVVGLTNAQGRNTNIQGYFATLGSDGGEQKSILSFNEIDVTTRKAGQFTLKEDGAVILRLQISEYPMNYTLLLRPSGER